jgi:hypothetical protein
MKIIPRIKIKERVDNIKLEPIEDSIWYKKCETCRHFKHPQLTGINQPKCNKVLKFSHKILLCYDKRGNLNKVKYTKHFSEINKKLI